jgi:hypothetical protein
VYKPGGLTGMVMGRKPLFVILLCCVCIASLAAADEPRFKTKAGSVILGGAFSFAYLQTLLEGGNGFLDLRTGPMFGTFLTKDTCVLTHLDFGFHVDFPSFAWNGTFVFGVQGRYFFTTEETVNFYLGVEVEFGLRLLPDYTQLNEHLLTGPVAGFFIPFNSKTGLDITLFPLFYLPLNSHQPFAMLSYMSVSMFTVL